MLAVIIAGNTDTLQPTQFQVIRFHTYRVKKEEEEGEEEEEEEEKIEMAVFKCIPYFSLQE
jgi:hypothetical protein